MLPGEPFPLGATWDGEGTGFALFSPAADAVELCLIDDDGSEARIPMPTRTSLVWHCRLAGVGPGRRYGYRVHGPWAPERGLWFNPAKRLIDPYAMAITGPVAWDRGRPFGYVPGSLEGGRPEPDPADSGPAVPAGVVVDPSFDWGDDRPPGVPWADTVIYEAHVRGLTMRHPGVPPGLRGTFAGLASEPVLDHLRGLGVTAVELMPVHHFVDEPELVARGLTNYWGYSPIGYLAPHAAYAAGGGRGEQVREFKEMVRALHRAGIEVILDVVYNHTAEGDERGPTLAFRGIDNPAYYLLRPGDEMRYLDVTGTGNTLSPAHPGVLRLIMDSLRYWVTEMHVDGFRFDLASALTRGRAGVVRRSSFLDAVHQDPVIGRVKLIAEPWDLGEGGYLVGGFPAPWAEWNGRFRDAVRDAWRGAGAGVGELATRLGGSSDLYDHDGRTPQASINLVTSHDGFTLADLVAYEHKHNEANGEGNRDGTDDNRSSGSGAEGPTDDERVLERRARRARGMMATLLLAQGVPMILAGDEMARSQGGNNNAYCQDNAISWMDWDPPAEGREMELLVRRLVALRRDHPVFRRRRFFAGDPGAPDVSWLREDGAPMREDDWADPARRTLVAVLNGDAVPGLAPDGRPVRDADFLVALHLAEDPVELVLPGPPHGRRWRLVLCSARGPSAAVEARDAGSALALPGLTLVVLRREDGP